MSNEAWKNTGDCNACRRNAYCKKTCSAAKRRLESMAEAIIFRSAITGKRYPALSGLVKGNRDEQ